MAKRGYKLQEFEAHSANVNCVRIGKKGGRLLITGGDDNKVNLWSIGKPTSLMSLCGHTTPIESVAFDSSEVLVVAGASTGVIKLWDLEEAKIVRTLTGHRSYCTALEFHPFGEFFASGSMDTNLKIWDIRKKGCIHTYKGHTRGISNIRFTPDGRWVVSGGLDNVVKVWDLTAGKLLHDFKFHEGHIRSIDFHPLEFLLATGSADKTVKFWDLETFELIGSTRPEATGVRAVTFHPDGKTLFCGLDDSLKVYSWEPVICHDAIDIGWSTLGDLCTHEGKLLGCSHYQNSVAVWVADIRLIDQYGSGLGLEETVSGDQKFNLQGSRSMEKTGDGVRSSMGSHSLSAECDPKDIKAIYVDSSGENRATRKNGSFNSPQAVFPVESMELIDLPVQKHAPPTVMHTKTNGQSLDKSFTIPGIVPRESTDAKDLSDSKRETIPFARTTSSMCVQPVHVQEILPLRYDIEKLSVSVESGSITNVANGKESATDPNFNAGPEINDEAKGSCEDKHSSIKSVVEKFDRVLSPQTPSSQGKDNEESPNSSKEISTVKVVNGVAAMRGRIRSLVERFERRESCSTTEDQATNMSVTVSPEIDKPQTDNKPSVLTGETQISGREPTSPKNQGELRIPEMEPTTANDQREFQMSERDPASAIDQRKPQTTERESISASDQEKDPEITEEEPTFANDQRREIRTSESELASGKYQRELQISQAERTSVNEQKGRRGIFERVRASVNDQRGPRMFRREPVSGNDQRGPRSSGREPVSLYDQRRGPRNYGREPASPNDQKREPRISGRESTSATDQRELRIARRRSTFTSANDQRGRNFVRELSPANDQIRESQESERELTSANDQIRGAKLFETELTSPNNQIGEPESFVRESTSTDNQRIAYQISERESTSATDQNLTEDLLQTHDVFLSTLRSRLTKLQVVRHFWERRDVKGAIIGLRKLPDLSVQADVISVLMEKMEILTLDLFSCLLPVLFGLLDSKTERHASISLEMLLKLVAVFGPVISSTISAPPAVGVDIQAEQRLECCKLCFAQLQKIQKILPLLIRRGGLLTRCARELDLVLQQLYS